MPVVFQKNISDTDISSNPEIFYALSGGERHTTGTEQILYIHNMKNIRTPWTDEYYVTNKFNIDDDLKAIKNLLDRGAIVCFLIEGYTNELVKTAPKTAEYLDLRLEELYKIYKPKKIVV